MMGCGVLLSVLRPRRSVAQDHVRYPVHGLRGLGGQVEDLAAQRLPLRRSFLPAAVAAGDGFLA